MDKETLKPQQDFMSLVPQQENGTHDAPRTPVRSSSLPRNSASLQLNIFTRERRGAALSC